MACILGDTHNTTTIAAFRNIYTFKEPPELWLKESSLLTAVKFSSLQNSISDSHGKLFSSCFCLSCVACNLAINFFLWTFAMDFRFGRPDCWLQKNWRRIFLWKVFFRISCCGKKLSNVMKELKIKCKYLKSLLLEQVGILGEFQISGANIFPQTCRQFQNLVYLARKCTK